METGVWYTEVMIRHLVLLRWNEPLTTDDLATMQAALDALPAAIPELVTYEHGPDLGRASTNFDFGIAATFAEAEHHGIYHDHPAHQQFIADFIVGRFAERAAAQFEV